MSEVTQDTAIAAFRAGIGDGIELQPAALHLVLDASEATSSYVVDLNALRAAIHAEIGYLVPSHRNETLDEGFRDRWTATIRWTLRQIKEWGQADGPKNIETLRALVAGAYILDAKGKGLESAAPFIVTEQVRAGLKEMLTEFKFSPVLSDRRQLAAHEEVKKLAAAGKYESVLPRFHHLFFSPSVDFAACALLLHAECPAVLTQIVELKDDINFSALVSEALGEQALPLALDISNVAFKFVCVAKFVHTHRQSDLSPSEAFLGPLLYQVAKSSARDWSSWMQAFLKYPGGYPLLEEKLALELVTMKEHHWLAFLKAPSLGFSAGHAAPFANLLIRFRQAAGDVLFGKMCDLAYQIWDDWNYKDPERYSFMFSPAICAFDYPVAVYYACQQDSDLMAEETRLTQAIDSIEQQWFESFSALQDERYRLISRLRLVQHGMALKLGSLEVLPAEIGKHSHIYYRARFVFHERSH